MPDILTAERDDVSGDIIVRRESLWPSHQAEREYLLQQSMRGRDLTAAEERLVEIAREALDKYDAQVIEIGRLKAMCRIYEQQGRTMPPPTRPHTAGHHATADDATDCRVEYESREE